MSGSFLGDLGAYARKRMQMFRKPDPQQELDELRVLQGAVDRGQKLERLIAGEGWKLFEAELDRRKQECTDAFMAGASNADNLRARASGILGLKEWISGEIEAGKLAYEALHDDKEKR